MRASFACWIHLKVSNTGIGSVCEIQTSESTNFGLIVKLSVAPKFVFKDQLNKKANFFNQ